MRPGAFMTKRLCLLHANCHGESLMHGLNLCPDFAGQYDIVLVTNYTRQPISEETLERCDLFLYQYLKERWGELASQRLTGRLRPGTPHLCIPNPYFKACWPLWRQGEILDHADILLDTFLERGLSAEETATLYLRSRLDRHVDLDGLIEKAVEQERQRQTHTPVAYFDFLMEHFRTASLFHTPNHPGAALMVHCVNGILRELGLPCLPAHRAGEVRDVHPEFDLPIHPQVADRLGLSFCGPDTRWNIYGTPMRFEQYVALYIRTKLEATGNTTASG